VHARQAADRQAEVDRADVRRGAIEQGVDRLALGQDSASKFSELLVGQVRYESLRRSA